MRPADRRLLWRVAGGAFACWLIATALVWAGYYALHAVFGIWR